MVAEPRLLKSRQDTKLFQHRHTGGEERFADVMARKTCALHQDDLVTLARQHGGGGAAAGAAADH
jgi:hypothetical protein